MPQDLRTAVRSTARAKSTSDTLWPHQVVSMAARHLGVAGGALFLEVDASARYVACSDPHTRRALAVCRSNSGAGRELTDPQPGDGDPLTSEWSAPPAALGAGTAFGAVLRARFERSSVAGVLLLFATERSGDQLPQRPVVASGAADVGWALESILRGRPKPTPELNPSPAMSRAPVDWLSVWVAVGQVSLWYDEEPVDTLRRINAHASFARTQTTELCGQLASGTLSPADLRTPLTMFL